MRKSKIILIAVLSTLGVGALVGGTIVAGNIIKGSNTTSQTNENYRPDVSGLTLPSQSVRFDGKPHSLKVEGNVPTSCHIEYEGNSVVDVGRHVVTADVYYDGTEKPVKLTTLTGNLEIYLNEVDYGFITPTINDLSLGGNGVSLAQTTITFNVEVGNLYFPDDLGFEFDYGIFDENSSSISIKKTFLYGNSYLFEITTPRLSSSTKTFTLNKLNYRYNLSYDINQSIEFDLGNEFSVTWTEDEENIFATIDNSYHQSPSKFIFTVDGETVEKEVGGNMTDYAIAFDKKADGESHTLELVKIIFNPTGYTSEFLLNSQFSYFKEAPITFFGEKVNVAEMENYEFATSTQLVFSVERKDSENVAHIKKINYSIGEDEFEIDDVSQEFYILGPTEYYKISATLPNVYGGSEFKIIGFTTEEDGFHLLNKQVTVAKKDFEVSANFTANYDYGTNKVTLTSSLNNEFSSLLTPTTININGEEINFDTNLALNGFAEELEIQKITFSHANGTYVKEINETIAVTENKTINGYDVVNNHYGYMFQEDNLEIAVYGTDFNLDNVISVTVIENEVETTYTSGFELIDEKVFAVPHLVKYGNHPTITIKSILYGNTDKQYNIVSGTPATYSFEEKDLARITYSEVVQSERKIYLEFECESSITIDYFKVSVYVDGTLVEDDGNFDAIVENQNIDLYSFVLSGINFSGNILEHNVTVEISGVRAYYNGEAQFLYFNPPYTVIYNQI